MGRHGHALTHGGIHPSISVVRTDAPTTMHLAGVADFADTELPLCERATHPMMNLGCLGLHGPHDSVQMVQTGHMPLRDGELVHAVGMALGEDLQAGAPIVRSDGNLERTIPDAGFDHLRKLFRCHHASTGGRKDR